MTDLPRNKTAIVLMSLERSLGTYIRTSTDSISDLPAGTLTKICKHHPIKRSEEVDQLEAIIQSAYLDEIVELAEARAKESSDEEPLADLARIMRTFELNQIRNAFAHPNRIFPVSYWYRTAAIAADPIIERLGFSDVQKALHQAEQGILGDIPDEWIEASIWKIPNNLPTRAEHAPTGLVGRKQEQKLLRSRILNARYPLISIQAPGGLGKTALALEVLAHLSSDVKASEKFSGLLYFSAKTEELTADGVRELSAVSSIEDIKSRLAQSYCDIIDDSSVGLPFLDFVVSAEDSYVCLCIDNAETFIRDNAALFDSFLGSLPANWTVLVTSRVLVNGANTLTLEALRQEDGEQLARLYARSIGAEGLPQRSLAELVEGCMSNPLAIRLAVDAFARGKMLEDAVAKSAANVAEFAYQTLIDTLPDVAMITIEAILCSEEIGRKALVEVVGVEMDELSESISALLRTSLISRIVDEEEEIYSLGPGVKQLILTNLKNIEVRGKVTARLSGIRARAKEADFDQVHHGIGEEDWSYLPEDLPDNLRGLLGHLRRSLRRRRRDITEVVQIKKTLDGHQGTYAQDACYWAYQGRVSFLLRDFAGAEKSIEKAVNLSKGQFRYCAFLARVWNEAGEYGKALELYDNLLSAGGPNISFEEGKMALTGRYIALLYDGKYDRIIKDTESWEEGGIFAFIFASFRASALKRKGERGEIGERCVLLLKAVELLEAAINSAIVDRTVRAAGFSVIADIVRSIEWFADEEAVNRFLHFIYKYGAELCAEKYEPYMSFAKKLSGLSIADNPFYVEGDPMLTRENIGTDEDEFPVHVYHVPMKENEPRYVFAEDANKSQYFLHRSALSEEARWTELAKIGALAYIRAETDVVDPGKVPKATAIRLEDSE